MTFDASTSQGLYLVRIIEVCMDASGDQSGEQQAAEKPIGIEEQKTIERQEAEAEEEVSTEHVNDLPATTTEEIIGKAQEQEQSKHDTEQNVIQESKPKPSYSSTKLFSLPNTFRIANKASGNTNNMLKQIQKQLRQIDKTTAISSKQINCNKATSGPGQGDAKTIG